MKYSLLIVLSIVSLNVAGQEDFSWWNTIHHWDGTTPWVQYMKMSAGYMGPNSLPVPDVSNGIIDSSAEIELAGDYNFSGGDKTSDFYTRGYLPLFENRMSFSVDVIPYEWFSTDTITRDERAARTRSGKGGAGGDIYFYTNFQLIRQKIKWPDLEASMALRTASGTNLHDARYTDGPGYFFDISGGKNFRTGKANLRLYAMCGFYCYQTYDLQHPQDDCLLFGAGADLSFSKIVFSQSAGGYNGYLEIRDKPFVYRASVQLKNKKLDWKISYQIGVRDYDFQRFRLSAIWHIPAPFK